MTSPDPDARKRLPEADNAWDRRKAQRRAADSDCEIVEPPPADPPVIVDIPDDDYVIEERPASSHAQKGELRKVLSAFQTADDGGIYVCESFRDPRTTCIDWYWPEVEKEASGINELGFSIGRHALPLSTLARENFSRFAKTLRSLADRVDAVLAAS